MPVGRGETLRILGLGLREVDGRVLYSAAWLDDRRADSTGKRSESIRELVGRSKVTSTSQTQTTR
jgi:hypothetical protein